MKGNSRTLFKKFCLEGSVFGLKYFYLYPDRVSRCYWAVVMVFCAGVAYLLSTLLYQRFSEMPTWITIEYEVAPMNTLPYPAITLCSPNQITISAMDNLKKNLVNGNQSIDFKQSVQQFLGFDVSVHKLNWGALEELQKVMEQNRYTVLVIMGMLPQRCSDFLKRCVFEKKLYPCEDLFQPILTRNGMCCTFNSIYHFKDNKRNERKMNFHEYKLRTVGIKQGLSVLMDYNPQDAMDDTIANAGATKVLITDSTEFPGQEVSSLIHPGAETFHKLILTYHYCSEEVASLPVSSRNCYFADEYPLPHFMEYRNTDCHLSCLISEVERRCRCTPLFVPSVNPHRSCNFTTLACIRKVKLQLDNVYNSGSCACLKNCDSRHYDSETIIGNLEAMEHKINNPYSDLVINQSTTLMYFYFPSCVYLKRKQETVISLISLVSNLGGVFGLCLGCSFISILEMWFYIYIAIKNRVRLYLKQRRRRRVHNKN